MVGWQCRDLPAEQSLVYRRADGNVEGAGLWEPLEFPRFLVSIARLDQVGTRLQIGCYGVPTTEELERIGVDDAAACDLDDGPSMLLGFAHQQRRAKV